MCIRDSLYTQWGAEHCPKIMATVDGEYRRIFGWDTAATGEDYRNFLAAFLPALTARLEACLLYTSRCV